MWKSTSFLFLAGLAAFACANGLADDPGDALPGGNQPPVTQPDATNDDAPASAPDTGSGSHDDAGTGSDATTDAKVQDGPSLADVDLDGPPPPPPPPTDGGNPAVCDTSNPVGLVYYSYEFGKNGSNAPLCILTPCAAPTDCCFAVFPFPPTCLNRGF